MNPEIGPLKIQLVLQKTGPHTALLMEKCKCYGSRNAVLKKKTSKIKIDSDSTSKIQQSFIYFRNVSAVFTAFIKHRDSAYFTEEKKLVINGLNTFSK